MKFTQAQQENIIYRYGKTYALLMATQPSSVVGRLSLILVINHRYEPTKKRRKKSHTEFLNYSDIFPFLAIFYIVAVVAHIQHIFFDQLHPRLRLLVIVIIIKNQ